MTKAELAAKIDHTILKPDATYEQIRQTIAYAGEIGAASVCLNPAYVALANDMLQGTGVAVCTVIGFPLGANTTYTKAKETENAYLHGAREMDMVLNISALKSGEYGFVQRDIEAVVQASPALVKVILENCYLSRQQIVDACKIVEQAGAQFVKTSTGFGAGGATLQDVRLMRSSIGPGMKIKAAGGIANLKELRAMLRAGADRIGMSRTASILAELDSEAAAKKTPAKKATATKRTAAKPAAKKAAAKATTKKTASKPAAGKPTKSAARKPAAKKPGRPAAAKNTNKKA